MHLPRFLGSPVKVILLVAHGLSDTVLGRMREVCGGFGRDELFIRRRLAVGLSVVFLLGFILSEVFSLSSVCNLFQPPRHSLG
jgi:hypothetical protein